MDSTLVLLFSLLCKLSDSVVLIPLVSIQLVIVFCLKTSEVELPLCGPARPGTQPDEDGGTLNCTGASLDSRTRLCLPGKLRASEAASGEVAAAPQRGRLVQGSQPGPALMLGTRSAESPGRPGRRASFTNPERDGLRLLLGASRHHSLSATACFCSCCSAGLPSQALTSRLPSLFHRHPHLPQDAPL